MGYATLEDLTECGLPPDALSTVDPAIQLKMLDRISSFADTFLRDRYTLPLTAPFDPALVMAIVQIAIWYLMKYRGFKASAGSDQIIRAGYEDGTDFLRRVANGQATLLVQQASPESLQPNVSTNTPRGYGDMLGHGLASDDPIVGGGGGWGV